MPISNLFWNTQQRRPRTLWRLVAQTLILGLLVVLLGLAVGLVLLQIISPLPEADPQALFIINTVITLTAVTVSMWLAARFLDRRPFADFGFRLNSRWWLDLGFGLFLGAVLITGIFLVQLASGWVTIVDTLHSAVPGQSFGVAILVPLALFLCVGIYEEMLSRGYHLLNLSEGLNLARIGPGGGIILAWALSSAVFGLAHALNPNSTLISTLNLTLAGLLLGLGYVLTGQLAIPIGMHVTWNFVQGNVFGFPVSGIDFTAATFILTEQVGPSLWTGGDFGPEGGLLGTVGMLAAGGLILLWVRARYGQIELHKPLAHYTAGGPAEAVKQASSIDTTAQANAGG